MAWTDPTTGGSLDWANGLVVASTDVDQMRENFLHIGGTTGLDWIDWTPTVDQAGAVTVTVVEAQYCKIHNTAVVKGHLTMTGAGTSGNIKIQGMPAAITPIASTVIAHVVGTGSVYDASAAFYVGAVYVPTSLTTCLQIMASGNAFPVGTTPLFALATSDQIGFTAIWETT